MKTVLEKNYTLLLKIKIMCLILNEINTILQQQLFLFQMQKLAHRKRRTISSV